MNARIVAVTFVIACAPLTARQIADRQVTALKRGDVFEGIRLGRTLVSLAPHNFRARYNLACALALAGDLDESLTELEAAVEAGYDESAHMAEDADLRALHDKPRFTALLARANQIALEGIAIPNARTVNRDDLPLKVRLRLPPEGKPRLAVWMHPTGSTSNADIERLAPVFFAHGLALVVTKQLVTRAWTPEEFDSLINESLPALEDLVDLEKPVLVGFSAGGQMALTAWAYQPQRFRGVIAVATAPTLDMAVLPTTPATPVIIFNGTLDPANTGWPERLPTWQSGGRRVAKKNIEGVGHEFLLDEALLTEGLNWLTP